MQVKTSEVPCPRGQQRVVLSPAPTAPHTHGTPFVKQLIIVKRSTGVLLMKFDNDIITFLTCVSRSIAEDQCSRIIYLIYLMLISLFSFVVFNVSVCVYFITYRLQFVMYMLHVKSNLRSICSNLGQFVST